MPVRKPTILCRPRLLPGERPAQRLAFNPSNGDGANFELAVAKDKMWPRAGARLPVFFMDNPSTTVRRRILTHLNAWSRHCSIRFEESQNEKMVRITRLDEPRELAGYWSYEGTDILTIPANEPTMNLEGFTSTTPAAEYRRVVRHEAGHTLGFPHEHLREAVVARIDKRKAIQYFRKEEGWTAEETRDQVLVPVEDRAIIATTSPNPRSIMCYHLPGAIMKNGRAVRGGDDITAEDFAFAATIYPKP